MCLVLPLVARRFCLCLFAMFWPIQAWADSGALEEAVKATYLYKLAQFVNWPPGSLASGPFTLCVVGQGPFGPLLDHAVAGQTVQQHPIIVRRYASVAANSGCQLMYIAGPNSQLVASVLAKTRGSPVLTVTDGQDNSSAGIVNFVLQNGYVRFEIDPRAAAENGLSISSKLLAVAVRLRGGAPD